MLHCILIAARGAEYCAGFAAKRAAVSLCRPANDLKSAQAAAQILYSLVCMDHAPSRGVAATLADALHPHFPSLPPVAAVRALWALGRCGHAAAPLLLHLQEELRRLTAVIGGPHETQADRRGAAAFATGAPWALASASADLPQGLAASCAALAANLAAAHPSLLHACPVAHLSSFLWGLSTVRPAVSRRVTRRLFAAFVAKVLPDAATAAPARPHEDDALFPHSTRVSFTQRSAEAASGGDGDNGASGRGGGEGRAVDPGLGPVLTPLDCVNVLVAAARFKFYDGALLQHAVEQLEEPGGRALAPLSLARLTDLADALGSLRMYSGCAVTLRCHAVLPHAADAGVHNCVLLIWVPPGVRGPATSEWPGSVLSAGALLRSGPRP